LKKIKSIIIGILLIISILTVLNPVSAYSIQGAIDAAPVGGTVIVPAGTYTENIVINKSLTLIGENKETTKIKPSNNDNPVVWIKASNVTIKNLTVYNDAYTSESTQSGLVDIANGTTGISNITIENTIIGPAMKADGTGGGRMGISIGSPSYITTNIIIRNNEIKDIKGNGNGIMIWAPKAKDDAQSYKGLVQNVLIENNYIHDIRRSGIESAGNVKDITIRNNTIRNCGGMFAGDTHPKYGNGIVFFKNGTYEINAPGEDSERRNILISNNNLENLSNIGIFLFGSSHDVTIEYNRITKVTKYGIMLDSLAGPDTPDPSVPLPNTKYKQKDDAFSNIKLIRNILGANGKNIELRTTYMPQIVSGTGIANPVDKIWGIISKNNKKNQDEQ